MPEYIDKSVVLDQISELKSFYEEKRKQSGDCLEEMNCVGAENGLTALEDIISDIPAADVAPIVHAKWIDLYMTETDNCGEVVREEKDIYFMCSNCECIYSKRYSRQGEFCARCGAKIDLEG